MTLSAAVLWSREDLPRAVAALVGRAGLAGDERASARAARRSAPGDPGALVAAAARRCGVEVRQVSVPFAEAQAFLKKAGTSVLEVPLEEGNRYLALLGRRRSALLALAPDGSLARLPLKHVASSVFRPSAATEAQLTALLERAGLGGRRRSRARAAMLPHLPGSARVDGAWLLGALPRAPIGEELRRSGLRRDAALYLGSQGVLYLTMLASWWAVGAASLQGSFDQRQLVVWVILMLSQIPLQLALQFQRGQMGVSLGVLFMRKFLYGTLHLDLDQIRREGSGRMLARVVESRSFGSMAMNLTAAAASAVVEIALAAAVLGLGAGGGPHTLLFGAWLLLLGLLGAGLYARRHAWANQRAQLTNALVERMIGHRTRMAQKAPESLHDEEESELSTYLALSKRMDRLAVWFAACASQGWMAIGMLGLLPSLVSGSGSVESYAVGVGGVLLGADALSALSSALSSVFDVLVTWRQVEPLYQASLGGQGEGESSAVVADQVPGKDDRIVVEARDLTYRYGTDGEPVLRSCSLKIAAGDRLLLQGRSGGGKSTLCSLLSGLRRPASGSILVSGWESKLVSARAWREAIVCAPQFHENHLIAGPLAFNLLLGRQWPPGPADLREAEAVCRELGLGELLDRMPRGLGQAVGELGWQLSHGERGRVFVARALLHGARLVILDEGLAALDPESLAQVLDCLSKRAPAVLLTAHP